MLSSAPEVFELHMFDDHNFESDIDWSRALEPERYEEDEYYWDDEYYDEDPHDEWGWGE